MEGKEDKIKKLEEIKEKVTNVGLRIARVPNDTKLWFIDLANEEFCGDYGMTLKHLKLIYEGFYPKGNEELEAKIEILAREIDLIKQLISQKEPEKKYRKTLDGKEHGVKRK